MERETWRIEREIFLGKGPSSPFTDLEMFGTKSRGMERDWFGTQIEIGETCKQWHIWKRKTWKFDPIWLLHWLLHWLCATKPQKLTTTFSKTLHWKIAPQNLHTYIPPSKIETQNKAPAKTLKFYYIFKLYPTTTQMNSMDIRKFA